MSEFIRHFHKEKALAEVGLPKTADEHARISFDTVKVHSVGVKNRQ
jgi:hypothetical protein